MDADPQLDLLTTGPSIEARFPGGPESNADRRPRLSRPDSLLDIRV